MLLIAAAVIYFVLGEPGDGAVMLVFVAGIITIEAIQEYKTDRTLAALKKPFRAARTRDTRREGAGHRQYPFGSRRRDAAMRGCEDSADGVILKASDLKIDESSLTGESGERSESGE